MRDPPVQPTVLIGDHVLSKVNNAKVLGIFIQDDLKWETHVQNIEKRANGKLYMFASAKTLRCTAS